MGLLIMVVILVVALLLGVYVAAIIFFRTSKQDPAFDDDHKTFESSDSEFEDAYQKALGHVSQGDPSEALTAIKNCIRLQPSSAEAFNLMGNCYNALNQLDDADYAYDESVKLSSDNYVDPKLGMAEIWVKRDELQRAVDLCQEVIKRTKDTAQTKEQAEAYLKIGLIYMMRNRRPEAMECYRELQKLDQEIANRLFERIHQET
jgi:tetratricopeptide (TPR) repeat protein